MGRPGFGPPSEAPSSACCYSYCHSCTASATRCWSTRSEAATPLASSILLLVGKLLATSLTISIGGSGGVFAPSLFIGAMLGAAYGNVAGLLGPHLVGQPGAYGLVGMGAVFAGAGRAPITSLLIIFELTGDYRIILPLMVAIVISTAVASLLGHDSIYTLKLRRRGIELRHQNTPLMQRLTVADAMRADPQLP